MVGRTHASSPLSMTVGITIITGSIVLEVESPRVRHVFSMTVSVLEGLDSLMDPSVRWDDGKGGIYFAAIYPPYGVKEMRNTYAMR